MRSSSDVGLLEGSFNKHISTKFANLGDLREKEGIII